MGTIGGRNSLLNQVTDNPDFRAWVRENVKNNPEFKKFGQENGMEGAEELWRQKRTQSELKNVHEIPIEEAIKTVRDNVDENVLSKWFRNADSDMKPKLLQYILRNEGTLNAGLNIAYDNYKHQMEIEDKTPLPFKKWLTTPMEMYRGTRGQQAVRSDIFTSYTPDKKVAAGFTLSNSGGGVALVKPDFSNVDMSKIHTIKVRPIDTWGSYQTTGEAEYLIPSEKVRKKRKK